MGATEWVGRAGARVAMVVVALVVALAAVFVVVRARSDNTPTRVSSTDAVLEAILEPAEAEVGRFGGQWEPVDRWITEGAGNESSTGCADADRLGAVFEADSPLTIVSNGAGDARLWQRLASLDWDALAYVDRVSRLAETCPTLTIGTTTVELSAVDPGQLGLESAVDVTVALVALDAFPVAERETDGLTPEFEAGRRSWLVVAARHNVVSQLVYAPASPESAPGSEAEHLDELARLATILVDVLAAAPIESTGPFERPAGPTQVSFQALAGVELVVDREQCRNDGGFTVDGIDWRLTGPVPFEWREVDPLLGDVTMEGTMAVFTGADGRVVELTTGATNSDCPTWDEPRPVEPRTSVGRLDCGDDGLISEARIPDLGQEPRELAEDAAPEVFEVEAGEPLMWWGLDAAGVVVVGIFLGDVEGADYQVFTCAAG